ncbi:MBL fold metallo-hydrolase [Isobaculum melis]|uniref:Glyoxylase, beta-lactamase superfamily II n=1 Tax=Isobaculum melis TaxID=142588 RepID=A0A1H9UAL2_9LACT|nr:MBL fold metallo-hydrolase [Isobaculum melis]SES06133.1 Glyoxylase, beta-lactamase superfamily II [Isobaculum melis]
MKIIKQKQQLMCITMPRFFPINAYLILEDSFCTLIDCSKKGMGAKLIQAIQSTNLPLKHIILTHAHSDHIGDVALIKKAFPQAQVMISATEMKQLQAGTKGLTPLPLQPDILLNENDRVGALLVKETPGHTLGSISLIDTRNQHAFVGDLIQTAGGAAIAGDKRWLFPFPAYATMDQKLAIQSFKQLVTEPITAFYSGHGQALLGNQNETLEKMIARAEKK